MCKCFFSSRNKCHTSNVFQQQFLVGIVVDALVGLQEGGGGGGVRVPQWGHGCLTILVFPTFGFHLDFNHFYLDQFPLFKALVIDLCVFGASLLQGHF